MSYRKLGNPFLKISYRNKLKKNYIVFYFIILVATTVGDNASFAAEVCSTTIDETKQQSLIVNSLEDRTPEKINTLNQYRVQLDTIDSDAALSKIEQKQQKKQLAKILARGEEDLRIIADRLKKLISQRKYCDSRKVQYENYLISIHNYFLIPDYDRLYVDHNDYQRHFFKLNVGYEYTSINKIFEESSPRIGMLIYNFFGPRPHYDQYGFGYYGAQLFSNLVLSGATEQKIGSSTDTNSEDTEETKTLGMDFSVFLPVVRQKMRPDLSHQLGFITSIGAKQTDVSNKIRLRAYAGLRSATSPENYIDVILGRSPGLDSYRLEIKGQMPVARTGRESRIFVGAFINMGIFDKQENEDDVLTVYMTWNIDFLDLFTAGG